MHTEVLPPATSCLKNSHLNKGSIHQSSKTGVDRLIGSNTWREGSINIDLRLKLGTAAWD
jgi:hypothetical protein